MFVNGFNVIFIYIYIDGKIVEFYDRILNWTRYALLYLLLWVIYDRFSTPKNHPSIIVIVEGGGGLLFVRNFDEPTTLETYFLQ